MVSDDKGAYPCGRCPFSFADELLTITSPCSLVPVLLSFPIRQWVMKGVSDRNMSRVDGQKEIMVSS